MTDVFLPQRNDVLGKAMSMRQFMDSRALNAEQLKQAQLQNQQAEQATADDQAYRQVMSQYADDPVKAIPELMRRAPRAGMALVKTFNEQQKAAAEQHKLALENEVKELSIRGQILSGATDQNSWTNIARPQLAARMKPEDAAKLPEVFDPKQNQAWIRMGMDAKDRVTADHNAFQEALEGKKFEHTVAQDEAKAPGVAAETDSKVRQNAAAQLGAAATKDDYARRWYALDPKTAVQFPHPDQFDPKTTPGAVRQLGMTPDQQATTAQAAANAEQTAKRDAESARNARANISLRAQEVRLQQQRFDADEGAIQRTAQSLANGDLTRLKDVASLRGDQRLKIYDMAKKINPKFDMSTVDRQIKNEEYYAVGKGADRLLSFDTFLQHANGALDAVGQIRLAGSPLINKPLNYWRQHVSGSPELVRLEAAIEPAKDEYANFLLGGHAMQQQDKIKADRILHPEDYTPAQLEEGLKTIAHVAGARFKAEDHRYSRIAPGGRHLSNALSPEALGAAQRLGVDLNAGAPAATPAAAPGAQAANPYSTNPYRR